MSGARLKEINALKGGEEFSLVGDVRDNKRIFPAGSIVRFLSREGYKDTESKFTAVYIAPLQGRILDPHDRLANVDESFTRKNAVLASMWIYFDRRGSQ